MYEIGKFYRQSLKNGDTIYALMVTTLKNGAHRCVTIENYNPRAVWSSTNFWTAAMWAEIGEAEVPAKLLAKIKAKIA